MPITPTTLKVRPSLFLTLSSPNTADYWQAGHVQRTMCMYYEWGKDCASVAVRVTMLSHRCPLRNSFILLSGIIFVVHRSQRRATRRIMEGHLETRLLESV